jgi:hypothetical protein
VRKNHGSSKKFSGVIHPRTLDVTLCKGFLGDSLVVGAFRDKEFFFVMPKNIRFKIE